MRFLLSGFSTVSREGVELSGSATTSVNADLRVGSLEETITVTGESPVVDLQSAERQTVLTNEVIKAIPTAGSYNALLVLVPALLGGQQDVSTGPCNSCTFSAHGTLLSLGGNRANTDGRLLVDGISIAVPQAGGTNYLTDTRNAQEISLHGVGQHGRCGVRRAGDEHHPALGRQQAVGQRLRLVGQRRHAEQQPERRAEGAPDHARVR